MADENMVDEIGIWGETEQPAAVDENMAVLMLEASELKQRIEDQEVMLDGLNAKLKMCNDKLQRAMDVIGIDSMKGNGWLFYKETKSSVKTPKTVEEKRALFAYLQERGIFDEMVSVNSQTLNSLYKSLSEEAAKKGILDFKLPGVGEPTEFTTLKLRRQK